jgi:hypothetical protein
VYHQNAPSRTRCGNHLPAKPTVCTTGAATFIKHDHASRSPHLRTHRHHRRPQKAKRISEKHPAQKPQTPPPPTPFVVSRPRREPHSSPSEPQSPNPHSPGEEGGGASAAYPIVATGGAVRQQALPHGRGHGQGAGVLRRRSRRRQGRRRRGGEWRRRQGGDRGVPAHHRQGLVQR